MMYRVNITKTAENDLQEAADYIAHTLFNPIAANNLLDKAIEYSASLSENPLRQPLVHDKFLAAKGVRSLVVNNYTLFYVVREKTKSVNIIRFIYSRRNWSNVFSEFNFE